VLVKDRQISREAAKHHAISILFFLTQDATFSIITRAKYRLAEIPYLLPNAECLPKLEKPKPKIFRT